MVFHRYLQDLNRTRFPSAPPFAEIQPAIQREPDRFEPTIDPAAKPGTGPGLLPKLGELPPIQPEPAMRIVVEAPPLPRPILRQTGSGRLVDLLA